MASLRQQRFIDEYMIDGNGTAAAIRAGYSPRSAKKQASRLLGTKGNLLSALNERKRRLASDYRIKREDVLAGFLVAIQRASDQDNPAAMISGWREVAKLLGFNEPERITVQLSDDQQGLRQKYEQMSDQELLEIASRNAPN